MWDVILDALKDSIKLIPFLFVTYLLMGFFERAASDKTTGLIQRAGKVGPVWGSLIGAFPQCGFSAAASNFYVGKIITLGTLISIYLSTSDEMLPIFISEKVPVMTIVKIIGAKIIIGMISGFVVELLFGWLAKRRRKPKDFGINEDEHCHCGASILIDSVRHTLKVFVFILIISLAIGTLIYFIGDETLETVFSNIPVLGELVAALVGLIPNCAASVVITQLYLEGIIGAGPMMSGLLVGAGMGLLVLFEESKSMKSKLMVVGILYASGVAWGVLIDILGITF